MRWYCRGVATIGLMVLCGCGAGDSRLPVGLQVANLSADLPHLGVAIDGQTILDASRSHQATVPYQQASREIQLNPGSHRVDLLVDGEIVLSHTQTWAQGRHGCLQVMGRSEADDEALALGLLSVQRANDPDADHAGVRFTHALVGGDPVYVELVPAGADAVRLSSSLAYGRVSHGPGGAGEPTMVARGSVRLRVSQGDTLLWDQVYQLSALTVYNFALTGPLTSPTVVVWDGA